YGVGGVGLLFLAAPLWVLSGEARDIPTLIFLVGALVTPAVLGVATVAPDTSSGGTSFLARLPIGPRRVLPAKLLAPLASLLGAICWLRVVHVAPGVALGPIVRAGSFGDGVADEVRQSMMRTALPAQWCGLGVGCLASVIAHKTMPAVLLAPTLASLGSLAL